MDHLAPGDEMKSYWTMWDIPGTVNSLPRNTKGIGKVGGGFRGRIGYEPPRSKGPGEKIYVLTVYALTSPLRISQPAVNVNRDVLLTAMKGKVLASSSLSVSYTRSDATQNNGQRGEGGRNERPTAGEPRPPRGDQSDMERGGQRRGGEQGQGGGGSPMFRALDSNRDGILDETEIQKASAAILSLDKNNDEQITDEELRGPGGGRGQEGRPQPREKRDR